MNEKTNWRENAQEWHDDDIPEPKPGGPNGETADWSEPEPIRNDLALVAPLDDDMIPDPIRPWISDISWRMGCPPDFFAPAAIVVIGSVIGAGCCIKPKRNDSWLVVPNLWGGVVARPGMMKSPALAEVLGILRPLEAQAKAAYDEAMLVYEVNLAMHEAQKKALKEQMYQAAKKGSNTDDLKDEYSLLSLPKCPVNRRFRMNDATIEKQGEIASENPRGTLLFRDELIGLLRSWDKPGHECDRPFQLESWNGCNPYTVDRIKRGTIHIENLCGSILGGIQPARLVGYLIDTLKKNDNDGLIQRFQLLVHPDEPPSWRVVDEPPNREALARVLRLVERLAGMDFVHDGGAVIEEGQRIPYYRFSPEAQEFFFWWWGKLEEKARNKEEDPIMSEHLTKYRSLMPSLAVICHLIEVADGTTPAGPVSLRSARKAAKWCDYLETHARRIYGFAGNLGAQAAGCLAAKIEAGELASGFSARDVYRHQWRLLDSKEIVAAALEELVDAGWLRVVVEDQPVRVPGHPFSPRFLINPKIRRGSL